MTDGPKIEEAILKEVDRLYKEVIDLTSYEPSKEDKEKGSWIFYKGQKRKE